jgi:cysteine desulfurase
MRRPPGLDGGPIYLDYNAITPVDPRVADAVHPHLSTHFGNPSSGRPYAEAPRQALAAARSQLAVLIGASPSDIVFTGGGSESDNLAVRGVALAGRHRGNHVITQQTEHPAVLNACRSLERLHGLEVDHLPVDRDGQVDPAALAAAITPRTVLVSIMTANGETGTLQPIRDLARIARTHGVPFHTDAAQAVGKLPIDVDELGVDLLTIAGHKMYAPKGVGALYVRSGVILEPIVYGGGQEQGLRSGTENVALGVALGCAAELARAELAQGGHDRLSRLRDRLQRHLEARLPGRIRLNGRSPERLPGTLNVSIRGVNGDELLAVTPGVAAATGSACHTGDPEPSPVLLAMGLGRELASSAVRLSLGRWTTAADVGQGADLLAASATRLLSIPPT